MDDDLIGTFHNCRGSHLATVHNPQSRGALIHIRHKSLLATPSTFLSNSNLQPCLQLAQLANSAFLQTIPLHETAGRNQNQTRLLFLNMKSSFCLRIMRMPGPKLVHHQDPKGSLTRGPCQRAKFWRYRRPRMKGQCFQKRWEILMIPHLGSGRIQKSSRYVLDDLNFNSVLIEGH